MSVAESAAVDERQDELTKAMDELHGVLGAEKSVHTAAPAPQGAAGNTGVIMNIPVDVQIILGSTEMKVSDLMALQKGSTVALDRRIGEPVDVVVNGRKLAKGEITVLEHDPSRFGIRLTEIIGASKG